jgi:hypothetical protein
LYKNLGVAFIYLYLMFVFLEGGQKNIIAINAHNKYVGDIDPWSTLKEFSKLGCR